MPEEETLAELRRRYLATNAHAHSYALKALRPAAHARSAACAQPPVHAAGGAALGNDGLLQAPPPGQPACGSEASGHAGESGAQRALPEGAGGGAASNTDAAACSAAGPCPAGVACTEAEIVEVDLNRTLAENGMACHSGEAAGDEPVLLLYWTDDLTSS